MRDWKNQVQLHIYIISKHKSTYACLYTHHFALSTIFLQLVFISLGPFLYCCLAGDWNCSSSTLTSEARWGQTRGGGGRAYLGGHSAWTACHSKGSRSASLLCVSVSVLPIHLTWQISYHSQTRYKGMDALLYVYADVPLGVSFCRTFWHIPCNSTGEASSLDYTQSCHRRQILQLPKWAGSLLRAFVSCLLWIFQWNFRRFVKILNESSSFPHWNNHGLCVLVWISPSQSECLQDWTKNPSCLCWKRLPYLHHQLFDLAYLKRQQHLTSTWVLLPLN